MITDADRVHRTKVDVRRGDLIQRIAKRAHAILAVNVKRRPGARFFAHFLAGIQELYLIPGDSMNFCVISDGGEGPQPHQIDPTLAHALHEFGQDAGSMFRVNDITFDTLDGHFIFCHSWFLPACRRAGFSHSIFAILQYMHASRND